MPCDIYLNHRWQEKVDCSIQLFIRFIIEIGAHIKLVYPQNFENYYVEPGC